MSEYTYDLASYGLEQMCVEGEAYIIENNLKEGVEVFDDENHASEARGLNADLIRINSRLVTILLLAWDALEDEEFSKWCKKAGFRNSTQVRRILLEHFDPSQKKKPKTPKEPQTVEGWDDDMADAIGNVLDNATITAVLAPDRKSVKVTFDVFDVPVTKTVFL